MMYLPHLFFSLANLKIYFFATRPQSNISQIGNGAYLYPKIETLVQKNRGLKGRVKTTLMRITHVIRSFYPYEIRPNVTFGCLTLDSSESQREFARV